MGVRVPRTVLRGACAGGPCVPGFQVCLSAGVLQRTVGGNCRLLHCGWRDAEAYAQRQRCGFILSTHPSQQWHRCRQIKRRRTNAPRNLTRCSDPAPLCFKISPRYSPAAEMRPLNCTEMFLALPGMRGGRFPPRHFSPWPSGENAPRPCASLPGAAPGGSPPSAAQRSGRAAIRRRFPPGCHTRR